MAITTSSIINQYNEYEKLLDKFPIKHVGDSRIGNHSYAYYTDYYVVELEDGRVLEFSDAGAAICPKERNYLRVLSKNKLIDQETAGRLIEAVIQYEMLKVASRKWMPTLEDLDPIKDLDLTHILKDGWSWASISELESMLR